MDIYLVNPNIWQPYETRCLKDLSPLEQNYAHGLISEFHNRHIGLPVQLVPGLVKLLTRPTFSSDLQSPWQEIYSRLRKEIRSDKQNLPNEKTLSFEKSGLSPSAAPAYVLHRIVMPLVEAACLELQLCMLFSEDENTPPTITLDKLETYDKKVIEKMSSFADQKSERPTLDLFWRERAAALQTYSSPSAPAKTLPDPDPISSGFALRLDTLPKSPRPVEHLNRIHLRHSKHRTRKLREDSISGVIQTRSPELLHRILISEMINPDLLLADRIVNNGYLVTERLPRHEQLRDVLFVAFLPPAVQVQPGSDFFRACWLNVSVLLYRALLHNYLYNSQIMLVESKSLDRFDITTISIPEIRAGLLNQIFSENGSEKIFRKKFIQQNRLLPRLVDHRKEPTFIPFKDADASDTADWVYKVWSSSVDQKIQIKSRTNNRQSEKAIEQSVQLKSMAHQYAYVHVMSFLSLDEISEKEQHDLRNSQLARRLASNIYSEEHPGFFHSEVWLRPGEFSPGHADNLLCKLTSAFQNNEINWESDQQESSLASTARRLEQVLFEEIIQEMLRE